MTRNNKQINENLAKKIEKNNKINYIRSCILMINIDREILLNYQFTRDGRKRLF